jgi:hypothetical protein
LWGWESYLEKRKPHPSKNDGVFIWKNKNLSQKNKIRKRVFNEKVNGYNCNNISFILQTKP